MDQYFICDHHGGDLVLCRVYQSPLCIGCFGGYYLRADWYWPVPMADSKKQIRKKRSTKIRKSD